MAAGNNFRRPLVILGKNFGNFSSGTNTQIGHLKAGIELSGCS